MRVPQHQPCPPVPSAGPAHGPPPSPGESNQGGRTHPGGALAGPALAWPALAWPALAGQAVRHQTGTMTVRLRTDADIGACLDLVRLVHATDGYPHHLPADLRAFLVSRDACAAWVAEHEGRVTGHAPCTAAARNRSWPWPAPRCGSLPGGSLSSAGCWCRRTPGGRDGPVPCWRRPARRACRRGLWPVLDVVTDLHPAIRLYEKGGWTRAGLCRSSVPQRNHPGGVRCLGPRPAALFWFPSAPS